MPKADAAAGRSKTGAEKVAAGSAELSKAPWEMDGRQWHTRGRTARNGQPVRWDGRILERIVDQAELLGNALANDTSAAGGGFAPTQWSHQNVVRIVAADPARISFPFFHAMTSAEWVVTLRFFVPRSTFHSGSLARQLGLVPFDESETPILCDQPRLKITDIGPFQEITIVGHALSSNAFDEFDTSGFEGFLRKAVEAFLGMGQSGKLKKASELESS